MRNDHFIMLVGSVGLIGFLFAHVAPSHQPGIKRANLQQHDLSSSGREAVQVRIDFTSGTSFGKHSHPGEEIIYVLEGVLEYRVGSKAPVTLESGGVLFIPAGTIHSAKNIGSGNAAELATYIVEKGKPLVSMETEHSIKRPQ